MNIINKKAFSCRMLTYAFVTIIFSSHAASTGSQSEGKVKEPDTIKTIRCLPATLLTPLKKINVQKVMHYPMPDIIARYRKDYKVSERMAKIHERELKRYLIIAAEYSDAEERTGMLSTEVDNLWHTFLLFTKEYQQFCSDMFGRFIHHVPLVTKL